MERDVEAFDERKADAAKIKASIKYAEKYYNKNRTIVSSLNDERTLHVGQLTRTVHGQHLEEVFSNFGEVTNVNLIIDNRVGWSKGYAFVEMASVKDARVAQEHLDDAWLDGQKITVKFIQKKITTEDGKDVTSKRERRRQV